MGTLNFFAARPYPKLRAAFVGEKVERPRFARLLDVRQRGTALATDREARVMKRDIKPYVMPLKNESATGRFRARYWRLPERPG
jgi:hypothetical protein